MTSFRASENSVKYKRWISSSVTAKTHLLYTFFIRVYWTYHARRLESRTLTEGHPMNPRLRIPRRMSLQLVLMHLLLITLVTVAMVTTLPVSSLNG